MTGNGREDIKAGIPVENPRDPWLGTPDAARGVFGAMTKAAAGAPYETVMIAAYCVLMNVIRQKHAHRKGALDEFDELTAKIRHLIADQCYGPTGARLNIFPFTQVVEMPLFRKRKETP